MSLVRQRHHGAHGDLRPNLRFIEYEGFFDLRTRKTKKEGRGGSSKNGGESSKKRGLFEEGGFFEEEEREGSSKKGRGEVFILQTRRSKNPHLRSSDPKIEEPPSSIFDLRSRRSKTPIRSSKANLEAPPPTFDIGSRRSKNPSSIFDLRSRRSKNPSSSIFGFEEWVEDRTKEGGWNFFFRRMNHHLPPSRHEDRRTLHLPSSRSKEWTKIPLVILLSTPAGHQLPSAILRSGSSDRSSTLKIGPNRDRARCCTFAVSERIFVARLFRRCFVLSFITSAIGFLSALHIRFRSRHLDS